MFNQSSDTEWPVKSEAYWHQTLNYSRFHIGGTETNCFLLLWQPEGQAQQHVHSVQKLCCTAQLQQGLYNVLSFSVVTCLFTAVTTQVEDELPVEGTPAHQAIMKTMAATTAGHVAGRDNACTSRLALLYLCRCKRALAIGNCVESLYYTFFPLPASCLNRLSARGGVSAIHLRMPCDDMKHNCIIYAK